MPVAVPRSLDEAVRLLADDPDAMLLAGGTDAMVEINDGHRRPGRAVIALNRVTELRSWRHDPTVGTLTIGAGVTYKELMTDPIATWSPALAEASRTVGSPQIRAAGTLGGNVGTCSPAGDGLPVLAALDAKVRLVSAAGERTVPVGDVMVGVKRTSIRPGELIADLTVPIARGAQGYAKVGVRNAMVIAVASACLVIDDDAESVAIALGSVAPTVVRCPEAESVLTDSIDWANHTVDTAAVAAAIGHVRATAQPITDHRSTADYRRHAVGVLVERLLRRAFDDRAGAAA